MNIIFIALVLSLSCLGWSWDGGWDAGDINGVDIKLDASSFSGNLDSTVTDVQLLANAVDVLVSGGAINWDDPVVVAAIAAQVGWTKGTGKVYTSTATDNVGIGTLLPTSKLSITTAGTNANAMSNTGSDLFVKGNIEFDGKIYGDGSLLTGITGGSGTPGGSSGQIQYNSAGAFGGVDGLIYSGTSLSYASNLGVGTTAPSRRLHVQGQDNYPLRVVGTNGASSYMGAYDTTYSGFWGNVEPATTNFALISGSTGTAVNSPTGGVVFFTINGSEKARFDGSGNLGIGVLSPTVKLSVSGSSSITGTLSVGTANVTNNLVVSGCVGIGSATPSARLNVIGSGSTTGMTLSTRNSALTSTLVVMDNGNVGIGTTDPVAKFQIVGAGNTGIGTTVTPQILTVAGRVNFVGIGTTTAGTLSCYKADGTLGWCSGSVTGNACANCN